MCLVMNLEKGVTMQIAPTHQPTQGPPEKPIVKDPVLVKLDIPLYYAAEQGPVPWHHSILCGRAFAETVLQQCNEILTASNCGLVHIGIYNPRQARRKDGTLIQPIRWSNHAYGEAMDWSGVITDAGNGDYLNISKMKGQCPEILQKIIDTSRQAIAKLGREPEMVDEGGWYHIGLWP
jgi:hypothetical protein